MLGGLWQSYYDSSANWTLKKKNLQAEKQVIMEQELMFLRGSEYNPSDHSRWKKENTEWSLLSWKGFVFDPLWWMSGVRSSFSRCTIPEPEWNIDHLIDTDLSIQQGCFLFFLQQDLPSFLKTFLPSIMYCFIPWGRREARGGVSHHLNQPFPPTEKKKKTQQTCSCDTTKICLIYSSRGKILPKANRWRDDALQHLQKTEWREMWCPQQ